MLIKDGLCWRIGKGDQVSFWYDSWLQHGPIFLHMDQSCDLLVWNCNLLQSLLHQSVVDRIDQSRSDETVFGFS